MLLYVLLCYYSVAGGDLSTSAVLVCMPASATHNDLPLQDIKCL